MCAVVNGLPMDVWTFTDDFLIGPKLLVDVAYITSGVIQCSCLGSILFLMFINDLFDIFRATVTFKLFADDVSCILIFPRSH